MDNVKIRLGKEVKGLIEIFKVSYILKHSTISLTITIGWAYAKFFKLLSAICTNRRIKIKQVNPAFSSLIGLVKYLRQYGISSDVSAAIVIARRGMKLSEKLPRSLTAYLSVNARSSYWTVH